MSNVQNLNPEAAKECLVKIETLVRDYIKDETDCIDARETLIEIFQFLEQKAP
jgi:hypothetical protein